MKRTSLMLPFSILAGAVVLAGAWMSQPAGATRTTLAADGDIAFVDVYDIVDIVVMSEESGEERIAYEDESRANLGALEAQLSQMLSQLQSMDPNAAETQQLYGQYQQLTQIYQQTNNSVNQGYQTLLADQIARAYTDIHQAVNEVAAKEGYTFVFATSRGNELTQKSTLNGVTQEILSRPLVTPPESVDLTETVRLHMGLPTLEEAMEQAQAMEEARAAEAEAEAAAAAGAGAGELPAQDATDAAGDESTDEN